VTLLPTPLAGLGAGSQTHRDGNGYGQSLTDVVALLPTPNPFHMTNDESPDEWRARRLDVHHRTGTRHGPALPVVIRSLGTDDVLTPDTFLPREARADAGKSFEWREQWAPQLLPTPIAQAGKHGGDDRGEGTLDDYNLWTVVERQANVAHGGLLPTPTATLFEHDDAGLDRRRQEKDRHLLHEVYPAEFDGTAYAPALARWAHVLGRPAPPPTLLAPRGHQVLSPRFVEWMMGLPNGWVVDVPELKRSSMLTILGNGVVPQQAAAAIRHLLAVRADVIGLAA
jgi:DNA (cytosine-5)-methyltransferase 1